MNNKFVMIFVF